jgi:DNA repair exonuclease SbcCD ATPase subunit
MNFKDLIKRAENVDREFKELETDLAVAFDECLSLDDQSPPENGGVPDEDLAGDNDSAQPEDSAAPAEASPRLTSYTQTRLAALSAVDGLFHDAQDYLEEIDAKRSQIAISHNLIREFLNILHRDMLRANELELANASLTAEQRALSEQLHDTIRKQREREGAVEVLQQREASLVQEREALRSALAAVRLELVEAANASAKREAEFGDIVKTLAAKMAEASRRARENKVLREKHVSLSIDLDKALKREAEARHRLDELSTIHASEAGRLSELLAALGKSEKEEMRVRKSLEIAQTKLAEMNEAARIMESDREAELARGHAEMSGLRSEIQDLQSRLELASSQNSDAAAEIARFKAQWSDAVAERQIADEKLSALMKESERDKMNLSMVNANFSQLSLQQASEQMQFDVQRQECEDLRAEVASLNARIKELLPYERLHRVTNAKPREGVVVEINGVVAEAARASRRRGRRNLRATS